MSDLQLPRWFPQLLGAQATVVNQDQLPMRSPYSGDRSLGAGSGRDDKTSHTRAVGFGSQVTDNLQLYLDMEWATGRGINNGSGLGGYTNGEVIRAGSSGLKKDPYFARAYARYLVPLGEARRDAERSFDQLPGQEPVEYLAVKGGMMAASDDFDQNRYANSARTQFLNFALINNGAWDFAADTRGFTNGAMAAWVKRDWSLRAGVYQMPTLANNQHLDDHLRRAQGSNLEVGVKPFENDATVRMLAYVNQAAMGRYSNAIATARATGSTPSIRNDDQPGRVKYGIGLNLEVPLADDGDTGLFARLGWNDGKTETFAFTEIDRTISVGGQLSGAHWGREKDWLAAGMAVDFLSTPHKDYLAAGGSGFMVGDGRINYAPETIFETYYSFHIFDWARLSPDYQLVVNPAYNSDRGPVNVLSVRLRVNY